MIRCALPETKTELADQYLRVDDAPGPDRARLAGDDPARDLADFVGLPVDDDRVARVRAALITADEVGVLSEEIDDLALALVAPLGADDDGGRHGAQSGRRRAVRSRASRNRHEVARESAQRVTHSCGSPR
jgi:hypothetical protein